MKKTLKTKTATKDSKLKSRRARWQLKLYVAGQTGRSETALKNLRSLCETYLKDAYELEVIDLLEQPQLAKGDQILAIPTLIKKVPKPARKIIGDLSDMEKVLVGLDIQQIGAF